MALQEGQLVGQYKIVGTLGQGGMAAVYRAYHPRLDRNVAIKVMHKGLLEDDSFRSRFEREARIVAKLEHPHIVPVYDFDEVEGQPYLVMKIIEGQTLKRVLASGPLPLDQIVRIMDDIADALTYSHEHGVLHRDVKPSNIVIDQKGEPYLTDFGLARVARAGASTMSADMILGTPQYISPEQAGGQADLTPATDVYSLGVILYEMVVGRVPFNSDTPYAVVHDHIYTELPRPSEINPVVPPQVEAVLMKALAKKPGERYSSPNQMMQAFEAACAAAGLTTLPDDRDKVADASFMKRENPHLTSIHGTGDSVTLPPQSLQPPSAPVIISSPMPPQPAKPSLFRADVPGDGRKVEWELNLDNTDLKKVGERIKESFQRNGWLDNLEEKLEGLGDKIEEAVENAAENKGDRRGKKSRRRKGEALSSEEEIRQRVEKRYKERQGLIAHAIPYLMVNAMLWLIWLGSGVHVGIPWPMWVTVFWGIGFFSHLASYYSKYGTGAQRREAEIQREIERERERSVAFEKPKRDPRLRLTDDGEIEEVYDDATSMSEKRKNR
ncbi:MAG: protein kinase [Anaerolineae bacterium]